jgi:hypothetical protein
MALFIVAYDLRKKGEFDYQKLWDEFDRLDSVKFQESDYFLSADNNTTTEVKDHFRQFVHEDDLLMAVRLDESDKPKFTKALRGTTDWVNAHWS